MPSRKSSANSTETACRRNKKMSAKETFGQELSALREARKATGIDDCTVVTWDDERTTEDGIRIVPA